MCQRLIVTVYTPAYEFLRSVLQVIDYFRNNPAMASKQRGCLNDYV